MLLSIAAFEFRYILRAPLAWFVGLGFFALGLLAFAYMAGEGASDIFRLGRNVRLNAPFYIAVELVVISLAAWFVAPVFVGAAIVKDREYDFEGIVFTSSVPKFDYLYGRFLGGFGALLVTFLGAPLGMILSPSLLFAVPADSLGPFEMHHYLVALVVYALPSLLLFSSIAFVVAVVARQTLLAHLLNLAVAVVLFAVTAVVAGRGLLSPETLTLTDPTLLPLLINLPTYWPPELLNTTLISAAPRGSAMLLNRAAVTVLALLLLGLAYLLFSFTRHAAKPRRSRAPAVDAAGGKVVSPLYARMPATLRRTPVWSRRTALGQFLLRTRFECGAVLRSLPFLLLMLVNLGLMAIDRLPYAAETSFLESFVLLNVLGGGDLTVFLILAVMMFSPAIVWREHQHRFHEVIHALPAPNWVFVASKLLALICIVVAIAVVNVALAMAFQAGDTAIDFALYLERGLFLLAPFIYFAVLANFLQVGANNRFGGTALAVGYLAVTVALYVFGFQHPLYQNYWFADAPLPLSGMDSEAAFQVKGYWLRGYWAGISGMVLLLTYVLFSRGVPQPLKYRLRGLHKFRMAGFYVPAGMSFLVALGAGSFIYYNTNVLNPYVSRTSRDAQLAQYERLYRQYEDLPMPKITDIAMDLAIFPATRRLEFQAGLTLVNKSAQTLDTIHLELPFGIEFESIDVPGAMLRSSDPVHRYDIYELATPMAPGERRVVNLRAHRQLRGFRAAFEDTSLVENGTYVEIAALIPHIGFSETRLLTDAKARREHGLDPVLPLGKLDEDPARSRYFNTGARADSDLVTFAATLSTEAGQTAVTAGRLIRQWEEGGRHFFRYRTDVPIYPVIPFFSARYAVLRDTWRDPAVSANSVDIEIYYHPQHDYHLELMMQGLKDGLSAFGSAYGPYQYRQLRVMEYPGYRRNSRSLPTVIAHSEANGFVQRDPVESYETMAHELAHHWWAHQVLPARVEGAGVLVEGLASYSARMLLEAEYGKEISLHRFFIPANRRYLRGRNNDQLGERPLYRAAAQDYLDYSKAESVMYALQNHLGEELVNAALREFVATYKNRRGPYAVTTNFLEILKRRAGAEHRQLIEDLFERITLYEFSLRDARAEALDDGRYRVTVDLTTAKIYGDENGRETPAEFDSPVNIGLFTRRPRDRSFRHDEDVVLYELRSPGNGASTVEFIVDALPLFAGINPYDVLIERDSSDNIREVTPP